MNLGEARSAIVGMLTEHRPTMDFSVPNAVLDFHIFSAASRIMKEEKERKKQAFSLVEPWMITNLTCQPILAAPYDCYTPKACKERYKIELPAKPAEIDYALAIHQVFIQNSGVDFRYIPWGHLSHADHTEFPPSEMHPAYTFMESTIYLFGGTRDLRNCLAQVDYVAGEAIREPGSCPDLTTRIGVPGGMADMLVKRVYEMLTLSEQQHEDDTVDDGNDQTQPNEP